MPLYLILTSLSKYDRTNITDWDTVFLQIVAKAVFLISTRGAAGGSYGDPGTALKENWGRLTSYVRSYLGLWRRDIGEDIISAKTLADARRLAFSRVSDAARKKELRANITRILTLPGWFDCFTGRGIDDPPPAPRAVERAKSVSSSSKSGSATASKNLRKRKIGESSTTFQPIQQGLKKKPKKKPKQRPAENHTL